MGLDSQRNQKSLHSERTIKQYVYLIGVTMVLVVIFSVVLLASLVNLGRLSELSQKHLTIWGQIIREVDFANRKPVSRPLTKDMAMRSQSRVKQYLVVEEKIVKNIQQESNKLKIYRTFGWLTDFEFKMISSADVPHQLRRNIELFHEAPLGVLHDGFSYWDTYSLVNLYSGVASDPLRMRFQLLTDLQHRYFSFLPWIFVMLPSIVLLMILSVWRQGIQPILRQIHVTLQENIVQRNHAISAKKDLERGESELRTILNSLPAMVVTIGTDFKIISANNAYLRAFKLENDGKYQNKHVIDVVGKEFFGKIEPRLNKALGGLLVQYEETVPFLMGPRRSQIHYVPLVDESGKVTKILALIIDINEHYQMEETLRQSEENIRITLNSIGDAVIATDEKGIIRRINPVAAALTGWLGDSAIGQSIEVVFKIHSDEATGKPIENPIRTVLKSEIYFPFIGGVMLTSKNGAVYPILDSGAPILDTDNKIRGVVLVFRDVSEEYKLRSSLIQSEKMRAIGILAGGISHDFNNILLGISGAAEVLKLNRENSLNTSDLNLIDSILSATKRGADLSKKLTTFVRKSEYEFKILDVSNLVQSVLDMVRPTISQSIEISIANKAANVCVLGNEGALHSAILNIVLNASHAMPNGGNLQVEIENVASSEFGIVPSSDLHSGKCVVISIADTGVGIEPDKLDQIFEPFYTTRALGEGVGLGLSTAYGTILNHNGKILVKSKVSEGAKFSVVLPVTNQVVPISCSTQSDCASVLTATILLVDDEVLLCKTISSYLEKLGHKLLIAHNGKEAIELFRSNAQEIQVVIIDFNMPQLDGGRAVLEMKEIAAHCCYIGMTGHIMGNFHFEGQSIEVDTLLQKPFRLSTLQDCIQQALRNKSGRQVIEIGEETV